MRLSDGLVDVRPLRAEPVWRRLFVGTSLSAVGGQITLVAAGVAGLPALPPADDAVRRRGLLREGLGDVVRRPVLRDALLTDLVATVPAMPISLFPAVVEQRFGGDPRMLGLFFSAIAVGGIAPEPLPVSSPGRTVRAL